jgi:hypothetical protein
MLGDPTKCHFNAMRCMKLAARARTAAMRVNLVTMAELWNKLAAETEFDQALLATLSQLEPVEPYEALPRALNLQSRLS